MISLIMRSLHLQLKSIYWFVSSLKNSISKAVNYSCLAFLCLFFSTHLANAQLSNFKFSTSLSSFTEITGGSTLLSGASAIGAVSSVTSIGFTFKYQGINYTQFSVNAAGLLKLGGTAVTTENANNANSVTNTPKIYAWWDGTYTGSVASGGGVSYLLSGSAPNRELTVQWKVAYASNAATSAKYQIKLYEGSNKIEFLYGSAPTSTLSSSVGLGGLSVLELLTISTAADIASTYASIDNNTVWPGVNKVYTLTPNASPALKPSSSFADPLFWIKADGNNKNVAYTIKNISAANRLSSSDWASNWTVATSLLSSTATGWISSAADGGNNSVAPKGWIRLDLGSVQSIDGVVTLGAVGGTGFVIDYTVQVSNDNVTWTNLGRFDGNSDNVTLKYSDFEAPVSCRYVRIYPGAFGLSYRAMRVDVYTKTSTAVSDNSKISQLTDQSSHANHAQQADLDNQATYQTNQLNFNPAINSINTGNTTTGTWYDFADISSIRQAYWVVQDVTPTGGNYNHLLYASSGRGFHGGVTGQLNYFNVGTWKKNAASATTTSSYDFGPIGTGKPNLIASQFSTLTSPADALTLGFQTGQSRFWNGPIGEIILFNNLPTSTQSAEIETYLALKYGISKSENYIVGTTPDGNTAATTLFATSANSPHNQNIFGIGRYDSWGLHQRQAKSASTFDFFWIGNNNLINTSLGNDSSVGNDLSTDNSFLVTGDDNGSIAWTRTASNVNKRLLGRTWLFKETGSIGSVKVSFASNSFESPLRLPGINQGIITLLVSANTDFNDGLDRSIDLTYNSVNKRWEGNVDFASGENYFTLTAPTVSSPGCVVGASGWWTSDNLDLSDGSTVSYFSDMVAANHFIQTSSTAKPTFKKNVLNFNPSLMYDGTSDWMDVSTATITGAKSVFTLQEDQKLTSDYNHVLYGGKGGTGVTAPYFHAGTSTLHWASAGMTNDAGGGWRLNGATATDASPWRKATATVPSMPDLAVWNSTKGAQLGTISYQAGFPGRFWQGPIPEILYFNSKLSNSDLNKVESYFALKYGITLGTAASNDATFTMGNGSTVWSGSSNTGYNNNIFGIGRDDCQNLHQRQSKSENNTGILAIGNNNIIDWTNGNTSTSGNDIANNQSYLIVGDNGLTPRFGAIGAPVGQYAILNKVWKAQETGTIGSVKLSFASGKAGTKAFIPNAISTEVKLYLVVSNNTNFADGDPLVAMTFDGKYWNVNADLVNGQYFTVAKDLDGPGCVDAGPLLWYKADQPGANPTTIWEDQAGSVGDLTAPNNVTFTDPNTASQELNFNPSYSFNGTNQYFANTNFNIANQSYEKFVVVNPTAGTTYPNIFGFGTNAASSNFTTSFFTTNKPALAIASTQVNIIGASASQGQWQLMNGGRDLSLRANNSNITSYYSNTKTTGLGNVTITPALDYIVMGGVRSNASNVSLFNGQIAEVLYYDQALSTSQKNKIRTYLAIKYGMTLDHDYSAGLNNTVVWSIANNTGYNNNIFGIGREDCQFLHQRQSKSVNTTGLLIIGNNSIIAPSNRSGNNNDLASDQSFLMVGDDNGELSINSNLVGDKYLFNRTWKINETGNVGFVKISLPAYGNTSFPTTLPAFENSPYFENNTLYLLMDDDGNFANGGTSSFIFAEEGTGASRVFNVNADLSNDKPFLKIGLIKNTTDTDGDGVIDSSDIDDDNDGVLDAEECSTLGAYKVYTYNRANDQLVSSNVPIVITGKSTVNYTLDQKTNGISPNNFSYDGVSNWKLMASNVYPDVNNRIKVEIKPTTGTNGSYVFVDAMLVTNGTDTYVIDNANTSNTKFILTGSNWEYQSAPSSYSDVSETDNTFVRAASFALNNSASYIFSLPFTSCVDTDGDGMLNALDTDSDGDGCNDGIESRAVLVNTTVPLTGDFGANGLLNSLETSSENGVVNYVSKYSETALDASISTCLDTDSDGVADYFDIDDDNDGILDDTECPTYATLYGVCKVNRPDNLILNGNFTAGNANWTSQYSIGAVGTGSIWGPSNSPCSGGSRWGSSVDQWVPNTLNYDLLAQNVIVEPNTDYEFGFYAAYQNPPTNYGFYIDGVQIGRTGNITNTWTLYSWKFNSGNRTTIKISIRSLSNTSGGDDSAIDDIYLVPSRDKGPNCDSDGDGLTNNVDLDSDGDGCGDAIESNVPSIIVANKVSGPFGLNGFADGLETLVESGTPNFTAAYSYAKDASSILCLDTDGDGVSDFFDLDDDNDGVLDTVEQTIIQAVANGNFDLNSAWTNAGNVSIYTSRLVYNGSDLTPNGISRQLIKVAANTPHNATFKVGLIGANAAFTSGIKVEIIGANNTVLGTTTITKSSGSNITSHTLTFTPTSSFITLKFTDVSTGTISQDIFIDDVSVLSTILPDTDTDGTPDYLDLDSDNDGCSDAIEAGTATISTSSQGVVAAPYGFNGFANSLESSSESGDFYSIYSYQIAIQANLNACIDSDNDGVGDLRDLDDDNDGVLDTDEQASCSYEEVDKSVLTFIGNGTISISGNSLTGNNGNVWASKYSTQTFKLPIHLEFTSPNTTGIEMIGLLPIAATKTVSNWTDGAYKFYLNGANVYGYMPKAWNFSKTYAANAKFELDISSDGVVVAKVNGVQVRRFKGIISDYQLVVSSYATKQIDNLIITSNTPAAVCADVDSDNDGTPNRLDIDSDGDGCNDAVEAGNASKTATIPYNSPMGANGLVNSLESSSESGLVNYDNNYEFFAKDASRIACLDNDNDNVLDYIDIDDDNDGVLDTDEQVSCVYPNIILDDLTFAGNATVGAFDNQISTFATSGAGNVGGWTSSYSNQTFKLPIHLEFNADVSAVEGMIGLIPTTEPTKVNDYTDNGFKYYFTSSTLYGRMPTNWNIPATTITANQLIEIDIDENGILTAKVNGVLKHRILSGKSLYKLVLSGKGSTEKIFSNVKLTAWDNASVCSELDTDGDGVVNRIDIDSDGDGCNDAVEAGAATAGTTVPLEGNVGANGLVNTKETLADNGVISYVSNYAFYALNNQDIACSDADGDGIGDIIDIDKDNDGLADYIEQNCSTPQFINQVSNASSKVLSGLLLKESDKINYSVTMSGPGVTYAATDYDGGNGIHFIVNDGNKNLINLKLSLSASAGEQNINQIPPSIRSVDFGPNVPFNSPAKAVPVTQNPQNIILSWPGAYGVVYDPNNQLSSHNTGDIVRNGEMIVQNLSLVHGNVSTNPTWKVTLFMSTNATSYELNASIFGDAALSTEAYGFKINACSTLDDDLDGITNEFDLDSDGDACSDAFEAGVSNATASTQSLSGNVGTNGLMNNLEVDDSRSTKVNFTPSYYLANSSSLNKCLDSDSDGIKDIDDIDDDNDGVLDAEELACGSAEFNFPSLSTATNIQTLTGRLVKGNASANYEMNLVGVGTVYTTGNAGTLTSSFDISRNGGLHYTLTDNDNVFGQTFLLNPATPSLIKKISFGVNINSTGTNATNTNEATSIELNWNPDLPAIIYDPNDQLSNYATGDVIYPGATITTRAAYTFAASTWRVDFNTRSLNEAFFLQTNHKATTSTNVVLESYGIGVELCSLEDTDDDGIANYLDLDSDGDNCSDAYESGATNTIGGANQRVSGPFGDNGFANNLEKTNTDAQTEGINYTSAYYLANSIVSACADTDNDNIPDKVDIDDDNDGILDTAEYACTLSTYVNNYTISAGSGMGFGGSYNSGSNKGSLLTTFTDLSSVSSVVSDKTAAYYLINDANTSYKSKFSLSPTNGTFSSVSWGPNINGNTVSQAVVNGAQSIKLTWNIPAGAVVYDPNDQLSSHTDGQGINPGDIITTRANYAVSASTWKVVMVLPFLNAEFIINTEHTGTANLGEEFFGLAVDVCIKKTDGDGDGKGNAVDTDSDGDGCFDAVESQSGKQLNLTSETILGPYGSNGLSSLVEINDNFTTGINYVLSNQFLDKSTLGCTDTDSDGIPDVLDIDDDNDGLLDQVECPVEPAVNGFVFENTASNIILIKNKQNGLIVGKATTIAVSNLSKAESLIGNNLDYSVSGFLADGANTNAANRVMKLKIEPVAPYNSLDLKLLINEGGNGSWWFHPRKLKINGGIAGNGIIKAIPQKYYLREAYRVGDVITPTSTITTAFTSPLGPDVNKVFIQIQYNALATILQPLEITYTWNALAGTFANENFGFQLMEIVPSQRIGKCDTDGDGTTDDKDFDSDGDGCADVWEAGHQKAKVTVNGNSQIVGPFGTNGFSSLLENNDTYAAASNFSPSATQNNKPDYINSGYRDACLLPSVIAQSATTFCKPDSVQLQVGLNGLATPLTYQWYKNGIIISDANASTYYAHETGAYSCKLSYSGGISKESASMDVVANDLPTKPSISGFTQVQCSGNTVSLESSYSYGNQWYKNAAILASETNRQLNVQLSGIYSVVHTDSSTHCASRDSINVVFKLPQSAPVVSITQPTCTSSTGIISISPGVNSDEYSINGTTYQSSPIFTNVASGTYSVTVKSADGCISLSRSAMVDNQPDIPPVATISANPGLSICAGNPITLTSSASIGNQWYKDGSIIAGATSSTLPVNSAGSYTVLVTNAVGCSSTSLASTVTINAIPTATLSQGSGMNYSNCSTTGPSVTLTANSDATNPTYIWYKDNVVISGVSSSTYTATDLGLYSVKITDASSGCFETSSQTKVTSAPALQPPGPASICADQSYTFTANAVGFTNPTYAWEVSTNGGNSYNPVSGTNNLASYVASSNGLYRVLVTDVNQSLRSCSTELKTFALPSVSIQSNPGLNICAGSTATLTANALANEASTTISSYQWTDSSIDLFGKTTNTLTSTTSGNFSVNVIDSNGCEAFSTNSNVVVNALPSQARASITQPTCSLSTGTLTVISPTGSNYQYSLDGTNFQSSTIFSGLNAGNYVIYTKDENACTSQSGTIVVQTQPQTVSLTGTISGNANPLANAIEIYSVAAVTGAVNYQWTLPSGWIGYSNTNSITVTTAVGGTQILVRAESSDGCLSAPLSLQVGSIVPVPSLTGNTLTYCQDASANSLTATAMTDATLNWYLVASGGTASATAPTISTSQPGTFTYWVSQTFNGLESERDSLTITVIAKPNRPMLTLVQPTCSIATGTITITSTGTNTDTYSSNANIYQSSNVFSNVASGSYAVRIKNANGCLSDTTNVVIGAQPTSPSTPIVTITQPTCNVSTGTITIAASSVNTDEYSLDGTNYQSSPAFTGITAGTYTARIRNANGCLSDTTNVVIGAQPTSPSTPIVTITQPTCNVSTGTITVAASGINTDQYSLDGTNYQSGRVFTQVNPGIYSITIKSITGCVSTATTDTVDAQPNTPATPIVTITQPTCNVSTGTITVAASGINTDQYSLDGTNYQSGRVFTQVNPGIYNITIKSITGCVSTATTDTVDAQPNTPATPIVTITQPTCNVSTGTITVAASGVNMDQYSLDGTNYQSGRVFTQVNPGIYSITIKSQAGCVSTATTDTVNAQPNTPATPIVT
ncbi:discoidin domain-containing protein, partial [Aquirufa sp. ROCK2-A2]